MLEAGMNVMRLNFSHGDYAEHGQRIQNLRNVMSKTGKKAAILLTPKGRKSVPSSWKAATTSPWLRPDFHLTTDKSVTATTKIVAVTCEGFTFRPLSATPSWWTMA